MIRNLDIGALRSFVAIADTEGVTKAAARNNLTQSAVSMQVKRLEDAFQAKLLHREGRGVAFTSVGEQLVSYARRLIALNDETWNRMTDELYEGEVTFGVPVDIVYPHVPYILKRATALYPRVRLDLVSSLSNPLKARLKDGNIDLILTTEKRLDKGGETLLQAAHIWHGAVAGKAYLQRPLPIVMCKNCAQRPTVITALDAAGIPWRLVGDTDSEITVNAIVSADLAVTPIVRVGEIPNSAPIPSGALPPLTDVLINMYVAQPRRTPLIENIAALVRDAYLCHPTA